MHRKLTIFSLLLAICFSVVVYAAPHWHHIQTAHDNSDTFSYAGELLQTTPDGYYFLRQADEYLKGIYSSHDALRAVQRSEQPPLISMLLVWLHQLTGVGLLTLAFYLPAILASALLPAMWWWGYRSGGRNGGLLGLCAAVAASFSYAWYSRIFPGAFDTDSLILPLFIAALTALSYPFGGTDASHENGEGTATSKTVTVWFSYMLIGVLFLALLAWWWPQGGMMLVVAAAGTYSASCVLPAYRKERQIKALLLLTGLVATAAILLIQPAGILGDIARSIISHAELALKGQHSVFAETGATVEELSAFSPMDAATNIAGHWAVLLVAVTGCVLFAVNYTRTAFMVGGPLLALSVLAFWAGNRFLLYSAPLFGMGLVAFVWLGLLPLCRKLPAFTRYTKAPAAVAVLVFCGLMAPAVLKVFSLPVRPIHNADSVRLAATLRQVSSPEAFVWNWWGPGYMQEYFTQRECLVDGGKQQPEPVYIASVPFAASDPVMARNWMKFFSVHRKGLAEVARYVGGKAEAAMFLQRLFADAASLDDMLAEYSFPETRDWQRWFFPEREVYVMLYTEMLLRSTWNSLGRWDPVAQNGPDVRMRVTPVKSIRLDRQRGVAIDHEGYALAYSKLFFVHPKQLSHDPARNQGPVAMLVWGSPYMYSIDQQYFNCLAYQLLFVYPENTPGFEAVAYNPFVGGIWKLR